MQGGEGESAPEGDDKSKQQTDDKAEQEPATDVKAGQVGLAAGSTLNLVLRSCTTWKQICCLQAVRFGAESQQRPADAACFAGRWMIVVVKLQQWIAMQSRKLVARADLLCLLLACTAGVVVHCHWLHDRLGCCSEHDHTTDLA